MDDLLSVLSSATGGNKVDPSAVAPKLAQLDQQYGFPQGTMSGLLKTESGGVARPNEQGSGANGFFQWEPATAKANNVQVGNFDSEAPAAAKYLATLTAQNGGDIRKGLAAYGGFKTKDPTSYVNSVLPNAAQGTPQQTSPGQSQSGGPLDDFLGTFQSAVNAKDQITLPPTTLTNPPKDQPGVVMSALAGAGKGFGSLVLGGQQLLGKGLEAASNILPDSIAKPVNSAGQWLANDASQGVQKLQSENAPYEQSHPIVNITGNLIGSSAIPAAKAAEGANLVGRMIAAAKTGAAVGVLQPTTDNQDYWSNKVIQGTIGAATNAVATPILEGATNLIGKGANALVNKFSPIVNKITGASPDLPEKLATASPELQQSVMSAVKQGKKIDADALNRQIEADSLGIRLTPGQATKDPILISKEMDLRGRNPAIVQNYNDQNSQLIKKLEEVRDVGAPDAVAPDHITAGETLINSLKNVLDNKSAVTSAAYKQLTDANGGSLPLDGQAFAVQANKALGQNMKGAFLPPQIQGILEKFQTGEQPMNFENFENLRTILATGARGATDGNVRGAINTVRDTLENMPMSGAENVKALADAARSSAKEGFNMLRANPALAAIDNGKATADNFIQKYVVNGSKNDLINLATTLKDDPTALQTMKAGVVNYLKNQAVGQTGNFSQSTYNKSIQALGPKLDVLFSPEEAQTLRTIGKVAHYTQVQPRGSYVNNSNTDVANYARTGGGMAASAVDHIFGGVPVGSIVKNAAENSIMQKASNKTLSSILWPGAGTTVPGAIETGLTKKLPIIAGRFGSIPLSAFAVQQSSDKAPKNSSVSR